MIRSALAPSRALSSVQHATTASLLSPFFIRFQQCRQASVLSALSDTSGAYHKRIRRGRGPGSGKGKTSGRGHKGQKQHGKVPAGFNGGQTPEEVVHGIKGFENKFSADLAELNISTLAKFIATGRIDPSQPITIRDLVRANCISAPREGVKLLGRTDPHGPRITAPIQIIVSRASAGAIEAIESAGGQVVTRYYSKSSVQRVMKGEAHPYYSLQSRPLLPVLKPATTGASATGAHDGPRLTSPKEAILAASDAAATHANADVELDANGLSVDVLAEMRKFPYRLADPAGRREIEYYRDAARRGYLSHTVEEGRVASLFFIPPATAEEEAARRSKAEGTKGKAKEENRLW